MTNQPVANIEAEEGLLGAILYEGDIFLEIEGTVSSSDFFRAAHQSVFEAIESLSSKRLPIDIATVMEELTLRGDAERIGGVEVLDRFRDRIASTVNATYHAKIIHQKAIVRNLIATCEAIAEKGYSNSQTPEDLLSDAETQILKIGDMRSQGVTATIGELMRLASARIDRRSQGEVQGVCTGLVKLDGMTDGLMPGQMIVIAGRPGMGKSSLALNLMEHMTFDCGGSGVFVTLEMDGLELAERSIASRARIPGHFLRSGALSRDNRRLMDEAVASGENVRLTIDATPNLTVSQIASNARRHKQRHGLDLLMIDYLQLLTPARDDNPREQQVAAISRRLKTLARELHLPVVVMAQLNRKSEAREDRKPVLSDLRESGAIEQDADVVLLLHRADAYDVNDRPGEAEMIVAKNRNGQTGTIKLTFKKELMRYENHADDNLNI